MPQPSTAAQAAVVHQASNDQPAASASSVPVTHAAVASVALPPAGMPSPGTLPPAPAPAPEKTVVQKPAPVAVAPVRVVAPPRAMPSPPVAQHTSTPATALAQNKPQPPAFHNAAPSKLAEANSLYREGRQYADQQRFADAIPLFDQAIQANPRYAQAYNSRCYAYLRLKDYDKAVADCSQAIQFDPSYANAYQNRGVALHFKGDQAAANEDFKRVAALQPVAQVQNTKTP